MRHLNQSPRTVSFPKCTKPAWSKLSDRFCPDKSKLDPIRLKLDTLETIDRAMDIQQILYEFSQIINVYYRLQILIVILSAFIIIVFDSYYLLIALSGSTADFRLSKSESFIFLGYQMFTNSVNILGVVIACEMCQTAAHRTGCILHRILIVTKNPAIRDRLVQFSLQLNFNKPVFTAFGLFEINGSLLHAIVGATTTYLVILIQFTPGADIDFSDNSTSTVKH